MRKTDSKQKTHFRSEDRIFRANENWWIATREGDQGPHSNRRDAEYWLGQYLVGVRGDVELNEMSVLEKDKTRTSSIWDDRPDVRR